MRAIYISVGILVAACTAESTKLTDDFGFDGTCVNCHAGLSAEHVHSNYKLRCIDCHGGNDQVAVDANAFKDPAKFKDPALLAKVHVLPKKGLSRFFFANGVDDDGDGVVDNPTIVTANADKVTFTIQPGESYEPQLHGEGPGEFVDDELQRDLNYTRFLNPGDLRIATIGCGSGNRAAGAGGNAGGCHQQTIEVVRRSVMVNQSAVTNGAYYGNESSRQDFIDARGDAPDPRAGAFSYALDYAGADTCIVPADANDATGRAQPHFDSHCAELRATQQDGLHVGAGAPGNVGLPAFEMAQGTIKPVDGSDPNTTLAQIGAGDTRYPWGGTIVNDPLQERAQLAPLLNGEVLPGIPDPVDNILRTFRAYYPLNYPGSVVNQNFTFGTSIAPDIQRFVTANPFGRGHSSGCTACHAEYNYAGNREPTQVLQDDGTTIAVVDPTTKHREFIPETDDRGMITGFVDEQLIGRVEKGTDQVAAATQRGNNCGPGLACQQKTYSANHSLTTSVTTKQCGLCHGFVTRINYAYQGMAEEEQRDQLARRKEVDFKTPAGTQVRILDSWIRMDNHVIVDTPSLRDGLNIITLAEKRDADLAAQGFIPGNGGCAQEQYSEDCNNDGELEHSLVLTKTNDDGTTASVTIDEDLDHDGKLGLIDRLPREQSIDGRQVRYVYGGRNGSTRLMDIHFQVGMHCIDCHFLQDVHGDGHVYSTNWDQIEVECEDCHGAKDRANLKTSGPNGGNDLTTTRDHNLQPFFETKNGQIIQHSRVTPGLQWVVPQTPDQGGPGTVAGEAHSEAHIAAPGSGSTFAGEAGSSALTDAKLECATCHSSWVLNCVGCHVDINVGDPQRATVGADPTTATKTARENEIWMSNASNAGHINFQLLGLLRAPFVLGVSSSSEKGRLGTFRSSMQAHVSVTDATGETLRDNLTFTTFQKIDGNSGRMNVATSGVAMNQTMAHTVRPKEARGCEYCHPLVNKSQQIRNEHVLGESMGIGSGVLPYVGDWGMVVGTNGLELYEHKNETEIATNQAGKSQRFPGMIINGASRTLAGVEPVMTGLVVNDAVFIRNFNATPASVGGTQAPTLRDLVVLATNNGGLGQVVISDISTRGRSDNPARPVLTDATKNFTVALPAVPTGLAHIAQDVSDPFVYAVSTAGVSVVRINNAPGTGVTAAQLLATVPFSGAKTPTDAKLAGDELYVATTQGTVEAFSLANPGQPVFSSSTNVGAQANSLSVAGFVLFVGTSGGLGALALDDPEHPAPVQGAAAAIVLPGFNASGIHASAGHVYVAAGLGGVLDIDARTVATAKNLGNLAGVLAPGQPINAADVIVSKMPGQTWLLVADAATGDMWGLKLDNRLAKQEKCFPDPITNGCLLDMDYMDPTVSGRDPSFDPVTGTFDATDPSGVQFFHQTATILTTGKKIIHPGQWEQIGTLTGRRLRDSFMNGSGVLSLPVMQTMRSVLVCESTADSRAPGNLGQLGYADDAFFSTGTCVPFEDGTSAKKSHARAHSNGLCKVNASRTGCLVGAPLGLDIAKKTHLNR